MAVRHGYGKIEGTDALVFAYDTGDTRNSYKGEPTTNYTTDSGILQNGWSGGFSLLDSSTKSFQLNVSNFHTDNRGWRSFMWDMRAHAGSAVTISATIEVPADSPGDFAWVMVGQANTRDSGTTTATYLGYSSASERTQKSTSNTERISWSGTVGNTGTANQPNGIIGFTVWYNGGTIGTNSFIKVSNVQIELKDHATPFIAGTRSATEGLKDLTGNTSIDLTDVSFDSNAQIAFDGTDDQIDNIQVQSSSAMTWEAVIYPESLSRNIFHNGFNPRIAIRSYQINLYHTKPDRNGDVGFTYAFQTGSYYHIAVTYDSANGYRGFVNGEEKTRTITNDGAAGIPEFNSTIIGTSAGSEGRFDGDIPVTKIYNRALTAAEVKNNYRHYKNRFGI